MTSLDSLRRQREAEQLHALGPRVLFEFIAEVRAGKPIDQAIEEYSRLTPELVAATGTDRFPPQIWRVAS